jgi:hypothetical protein
VPSWNDAGQAGAASAKALVGNLRIRNCSTSFVFGLRAADGAPTPGAAIPLRSHVIGVDAKRGTSIATRAR